MDGCTLSSMCYLCVLSSLNIFARFLSVLKQEQIYEFCFSPLCTVSVLLSIFGIRHVRLVF